MLTIAALAVLSMGSVGVWRPIDETLEALVDRSWTIAEVEVTRRPDGVGSMKYEARVITPVTGDVKENATLKFTDDAPDVPPGETQQIQPGNRYIVFLGWNPYGNLHVLRLRELTFRVDFDDRIVPLSTAPLAKEQEGKTRSSFLRELRDEARRARKKPST